MATLTERGSDTVAKVQDLSDEFVNAKSFDFPATSRIPKGRAPENVEMVYAAERYAAPRVTGAVDEADPDQFSNPREGDAELKARVHVLEEAVSIGGLATSVTHQAGVTPRNVVSLAVAKKLMELKRSAECVILGDQESRADDGIRGNETRGLVKWAQSTAQSHLPVPANYRTPSASIDSSTNLADYTDDTITALAESQFGETGNTGSTNVVFCGSRWKRNISRLTMYSRNVTNMTPVRQFNQSVSSKVVLGKVDMLETDFGNMELHLSQHINTGGDPTTAASKRLAVGTPLDYVELRFAERPYMQSLAKTGRSTRFIVTTTFGLAHKNPLTLVKWAPAA